VRTVFLGTSLFAAAVLESLVEDGLAPVLVVTRPDRPRGRGRRIAAPPVAESARRHGLELLQPEDVNSPESAAAIAAARPDAVCVCAFGALIREPLLSAHPMLNVHPSLLPRWRGAAPVERAIMAGDERTGVSIMRVTAGLDSGPVCLSAEEPIAPDDTYGSLSPRLEHLGAQLLIRALAEQPPFVEQDETGATYAEKITAAERLLDPSRPATELERVVRALHPHIGARLALAGGLLLGVSAARVAEGAADDVARRASAVHGPQDPASGSWLVTDGRLLFACTPGALELLVVQPPGGRPMAAADFLRGNAGLLG
jgi:methionyl-tRNA formyltransferase